VIYYFVDEGLPLYALLLYGKDEQDDLTAEQRRSVRMFAESIKATRNR
jgi:hypothetical protein